MKWWKEALPKSRTWCRWLGEWALCQLGVGMTKNWVGIRKEQDDWKGSAMAFYGSGRKRLGTEPSSCGCWQEFLGSRVARSVGEDASKLVSFYDYWWAYYYCVDDLLVGLGTDASCEINCWSSDSGGNRGKIMVSDLSGRRMGWALIKYSRAIPNWVNLLRRCWHASGLFQAVWLIATCLICVNGRMKV